MNDTAEQVTPVAAAPQSIADVLADLRGFGIEEFEEILTLTLGGKTVKLKLANVPVETDLIATLAVEGLKNYTYFQEIKLELLSRAITWINGLDIARLSDKDRFVVDPIDGQKKDIQVVLRGLIRSWGLEVMQCLWKVLMVHSQTIENRLTDNFPQAAQLTDVERRYRERIEREFEQLTAAAVQEHVDAILSDEEGVDHVES